MKRSNDFSECKGISLIKLAEIIGSVISDEAYGGNLVFSLASIFRASQGDISYVGSRKFLDNIDICKASAIICGYDIFSFIPKHIPCLLSNQPEVSFVLAGSILYPKEMRMQPVSRSSKGFSSKISVANDVKFENGVVVEPMVVIGSGVEIGSGTYVGSGSIIGSGVKIGRNCIIGSDISVFSSFIGNEVVLHDGVKIGSDGFEYVRHELDIYKMVHVGRVIIQDKVEIGANSTINRGTMDDTIIGENTKIGDQVQIGHSVYIGIGCMIASQVGISGFVHIGDNVLIASQSGIAAHINIGDNAQITAKSNVIRDLPSLHSNDFSPAF
ncbi:MAG: UDP-3-O-(3-hydroxymyristoyl)glucosamine N-acyltransferase [Candidatus Liberibacter europaeus]|uniref:UDP-3-O-(3-hydroxymyristoyl)glucosamine N-acyltransferase n=1 Tax=Candidatus Liberibacter europaeus TaxID=744859 RepID=A0A2T4VZ16_9HYPH|nr:UDP-3-O-(3-hydroxymyristoyl)glucosamine N-acyltransferase [Candidatus Liberibacter europaeus]PTL87032.1 MAG: UDP-3-O-(3-hydroxymyristoyl)glucosamine N-acyltransferase [Candidatus Liberibacter europaeus]